LPQLKKKTMFRLVAFVILLLFTNSFYAIRNLDRNNLTLVDLTTNNIPASALTDTLDFKLLYFLDTSLFIVAIGPYGSYIGTGSNHFIDTIGNPQVFVKAQLTWKLKNNGPIDIGICGFSNNS
jgi:hypothetical protein